MKLFLYDVFGMTSNSSTFTRRKVSLVKCPVNIIIEGPRSQVPCITRFLVALSGVGGKP